MQEELPPPHHYVGRFLHGRLDSLRRQNREKVSMVCEVPSRERIHPSIQRTGSKLKLKKELSRGRSLKLKNITEPEHPPQMYQFPEEQEERPKDESIGLFRGLRPLKIEGGQPSLMRQSPPSKAMSYKQILSKLIGKSQESRPLANDKLVNSIQKSDQSGKSKSKSHRKMPRVIDVFQLYDRKKQRCSKEISSNIEDEKQSVEASQRNGSELPQLSEPILESPVLTVQDFDESIKLLDHQQPYHSDRRSGTIAKQLASIHHHLEKFQKLIVRGSTVVPELPMGKNLVIRIYENWGDRAFVGLNGIEFFNEKGDRVAPTKVYCEPQEISSDNPHDNKADNLIFGVPYHTSPANSCLMPFSSNSVNTIVFNFQDYVRLSMVRIWNYNCSPATAHCGVKTLEIKLDGACIFVGGLDKAEGSMRQYWKTCSTLLLTSDEALLSKISQHDWLNRLDHKRIDGAYDELSTLNNSDWMPFTKGNDTLKLEVFENYGHPEVFRFVKISLFDCQGNELRFRISEGRAKEYPKACSIHIIMLESKPVQLITIRNAHDERALKRFRIIVDEKRAYDVRLACSREDQNVYLSTSILYGPSVIQQAILWVKCAEIVLRPSKDSLMVGLNKLEMYDLLGMPLLRSRQLRYRCNHPVTFDGGELDISSEDWLLAENKLLIRVDFEQVVPLAAICFFNYRQDQKQGAHSVHISLNQRAAWCGYLPSAQEQPLTSLFLTNCPLLEPRLARFTTSQEHFRERILRYNEGRLLSELPFG